MNSGEIENNIPKKVPDTFSHSAVVGDRRFTLRTLLAVVWGVAVLTVTFQHGYATGLFCGLPVCYLSYVFVNDGRFYGKTMLQVVCWTLFGFLWWYVWPRYNCAVDVPWSASHVYSTNGFFHYHSEVRFDAPVEDCIATAERIREESRRRASLGFPPQPRVAIDRDRGLPAPVDATDVTKSSWLTKDTIDEGWYYPGGAYVPEMWVDTIRGRFFYRVYE